MLKKILLWSAAVVVLLIVAFLILVARQPDDFVITRSATMNASNERVFEHINDLRKWQSWSPWAKLDPSAKNSFEGPTAGEGAVFRWSGNDEIGEGKMTITESKPHELVRMRLEFVRPMEDEADTEFVLQGNSHQTELTWTMSGKHTFMSKAMCLFMDMDAMVGGDFEKGLASLKQVVESADSGENAAVPADERVPADEQVPNRSE